MEITLRFLRVQYHIIWSIYIKESILFSQLSSITSLLYFQVSGWCQNRPRKEDKMVVIVYQGTTNKVLSCYRRCCWSVSQVKYSSFLLVPSFIRMIKSSGGNLLRESTGSVSEGEGRIMGRTRRSLHPFTSTWTGVVVFLGQSFFLPIILIAHPFTI